MIEVTLPALTFLRQIVLGLGLVTTNPLMHSSTLDTHEELYCLALNATMRREVSAWMR